jgi:hypothetical protein
MISLKNVSQKTPESKEPLKCKEGSIWSEPLTGQQLLDHIQKYARDGYVVEIKRDGD